MPGPGFKSWLAVVHAPLAEFAKRFAPKTKVPTAEDLKAVEQEARDFAEHWRKEGALVQLLEE